MIPQRFAGAFLLARMAQVVSLWYNPAGPGRGAGSRVDFDNGPAAIAAVLSVDSGLTVSLMRQRSWILIIALFACRPVAGDDIDFDLDQARWVHRVLVLAAISEDQRDLQEMTDAIAMRLCELVNRDLITVVITDGSTARLDGRRLDAGSTQRLLSRLPLRRDANFEMLLIGKDGGIKQRWTQAVPPEDIFALIDGMPMRQAERPGDDDCR